MSLTYGIIIGAGLILAVLGLSAWAADKGLILRWWHWVLVAIWGLAVWFDLGWLGTILGEGESRAAWIGFGAMLVLVVILGAVVYRLIITSASTPAQKGHSISDSSSSTG